MFLLALFGLIGLSAFCLEALFIIAGARLGLGEIVPRFVGFPMAVAWTWYANRTWNFRVEARPTLKEFFSYSVGMSIGALLNLLAYSILVLQTISPLPALVALAIATLISMLFNFFFARKVSFARQI